jgi:hypothetical protein
MTEFLIATHAGCFARRLQSVSVSDEPDIRIPARHSGDAGPVRHRAGHHDLACEQEGLAMNQPHEIIDLMNLNAKLVEALELALEELREYERERTGEIYNNPKINAALAKAKGQP